MPEQPEKPQCDMEDILCQMQVMSHLEGMRKLLGSDKFQARYPEFTGLGDTVTERIQQQDITIKEAFAKCGLVPSAEEPEAAIEEE